MFLDQIKDNKELCIARNINELEQLILYFTKNNYHTGGRILKICMKDTFLFELTYIDQVYSMKVSRVDKTKGIKSFSYPVKSKFIKRLRVSLKQLWYIPNRKAYT